jgi:phenylacetate-CoA ligase
MPIVRFRTHDLTVLTPEPCACGRTATRMRRVMHRTDDMLIIRGVNVFPSQVESVLAEIEGVEPHYQIVVDRRGALDDFELLVEVSAVLFADTVGALTQLKERIRARMESVLGLSPRIKLVEPRTLERTAGKARRVIDRREL